MRIPPKNFICSDIQIIKHINFSLISTVSKCSSVHYLYVGIQSIFIWNIFSN